MVIKRDRAIMQATEAGVRFVKRKRVLYVPSELLECKSSEEARGVQKAELKER